MCGKRATSQKAGMMERHHANAQNTKDAEYTYFRSYCTLVGHAMKINDPQLQFMLGLPNLLPLAQEFANAATQPNGTTIRRISKKNKAFSIDVWADAATLSRALGLVIRDGFETVSDKSDYAVQETKYVEAPAYVRKFVRLVHKYHEAPSQKIYGILKLERTEIEAVSRYTFDLILQTVVNGESMLSLPQNIKEYACKLFKPAT